MAEAVLFVFWPHDGPLDAASPWATIREFGAAEKRLWRQQRPVGEARGEEIAEPVRKMQPRFLRYAVGPRHRGIAAPANLDAAEQIRLRARHAVEERRAKRGVAKDFGIGMKAQDGAAPVLHGPAILDPALRHAAAIALPPQLAVARDLDIEPIGERVDDRDADPVQPARCLVSIAAELATRMQHGQDDFERGLFREARMRIDRDAAAVVAHRDRSRRIKLELDSRCMAGDRLVHRIVERFGGEVMQRAFVGAADIHSGAPAHRFQPL